MEKPKLYKICHRVAFKVIFEGSFRVENCPINANGLTACGIAIRNFKEMDETEMKKILGGECEAAYRYGDPGLMLPTCADCSLASYIDK